MSTTTTVCTLRSETNPNGKAFCYVGEFGGWTPAEGAVPILACGLLCWFIFKGLRRQVQKPVVADLQPRVGPAVRKVWDRL